VPSASSPVTRNAFGPIAATYTGTGVPPATLTGHAGRAPQFLAVKVDRSGGPKIDRRTCKCSRSPVQSCWARGAERQTFGLVGAQPEAEAELPCAAACAVCANDATIRG